MNSKGVFIFFIFFCKYGISIHSRGQAVPHAMSVGRHVAVRAVLPLWGQVQNHPARRTCFLRAHILLLSSVRGLAVSCCATEVPSKILTAGPGCCDSEIAARMIVVSLVWLWPESNLPVEPALGHFFHQELLVSSMVATTLERWLCWTQCRND